jgi:phage-related protein
MQEKITNVGPKVESEISLLQDRLKAAIHVLSEENMLIPDVSKLSPEGIIELKALLEEIEKNVNTKPDNYLDGNEVNQKKMQEVIERLHKMR